MELQAIDEAPYYTFASRFFCQQGHQLDKDVFHYVYNVLEGHTWYVQSVLKQLYADGEDVVTERQADEAIRQLVQDNNAYYETIFSLLPEKQQNCSTPLPMRDMSQRRTADSSSLATG